ANSTTESAVIPSTFCLKRLQVMRKGLLFSGKFFKRILGFTICFLAKTANVADYLPNLLVGPSIIFVEGLWNCKIIVSLQPQNGGCSSVG
ncbi:MAG: hypothetical protein WDA17_06545, partial [Sphaerochaetaceae bacterium]